MTRSGKPLSNVLNLRIGTALGVEISRIANLQGKSRSEVARQLLVHGVEVRRQLEISREKDRTE